MKSIMDNNYRRVIYKTGFDILNPFSISVKLFTAGINEMKIVTK